MSVFGGQQAQQDSVFKQAQEMFPQLDPEVIYMILSDNAFNILQSLDNLSILCPAESISRPVEISKEIVSTQNSPTQAASNNKMKMRKKGSLNSVTPSVSPETFKPFETIISKDITKEENLSDIEPIYLMSNDIAYNSTINGDVDITKNDGKTKFVCLYSYINVGKWNGVKFQFNGGGLRQPQVFNSVQVVPTYNQLDKQLCRLKSRKKVISCTGSVIHLSFLQPAKRNIPENYYVVNPLNSELESVKKQEIHGKVVIPSVSESVLETNQITGECDIHKTISTDITEHCANMNVSSSNESFYKSGRGNFPSPNFCTRPSLAPAPIQQICHPHFGRRSYFENQLSWPQQPIPTATRNKQDFCQVPKRKGKPLLYILRGLPGSGKSTLAKMLCGRQGVILSTDDYFVVNGYYQFDPVFLSEAHAWNKKRADDCMKTGKSPLIIDNTNITGWEMEYYVKKGLSYKYHIEIKEPNTWWKFKARELTRRNIHGVPKETIVKMLERFEKNVTVSSIIKSFSKNMKLESQQKEIASNDKEKNNPVHTETTLANQTDQLKNGTSKNTKLLLSTAEDHKKLTPSYKSHQNVSHLDELDDFENIVVNQQNNVTLESKQDLKELPDLTKESKPTAANNLNFDYKVGFSENTKTDLQEKSLEDAGCSKLSKPKKKSKPSKQKPLKLLKDVHFNNDWGQFISSVAQNIDISNKNPVVEKSVKHSTADTNTMTTEDDFTILRKFENCYNFEDEIGLKVFLSNSSYFQPNPKPEILSRSDTLDKATSTYDLVQQPEVHEDLTTLGLLFPCLPSDDLKDIYEKCGKSCQWTIDVVAESTLFGSAENEIIDSKKNSPYQTTLDEYYDNASATKQKLPDETPKENTVEHTFEKYDLPKSAVNIQLSKEALKQICDYVGESFDNSQSADIELDSSLVIDLFNAWKRTLEKKTETLNENSAESVVGTFKLKNIICDYDDPVENLQQIEDDEKLARRLQMEEEQGLQEYKKPPQQRKTKNKPKLQMEEEQGLQEYKKPPQQRKTKNKPKNFHTPERQSPAIIGVSSPFRTTGVSTAGSSQWSVGTNKMSSFNQIMQEEKLAEASEQRQNIVQEDVALASQLKIKELVSMFPKIPESLLNEIFLNNGYNMEETIFTVVCIFASEDAYLPHTSSETLLMDKQCLTEKNYQVNPINTDESEISACLGQRPLTYDELRAEANLQRKEMLECFRKAAAASHQLRGPLNMYYANRAQQHKIKLREANNRAAAITFKQMNEGRSRNELDLHGLHVDEAIDTLQSIMCKIRDQKRFKYLFVITGRGLNSASGVSKIKTAVLNWLQMKNVSFTMVNDGYIKIHL